MSKKDNNKSNNMTLFKAGIIIAITVVIVETVSDILFNNITFHPAIRYILRMIMYFVTILFARFIANKISGDKNE